MKRNICVGYLLYHPTRRITRVDIRRTALGNAAVGCWHYVVSFLAARWPPGLVFPAVSLLISCVSKWPCDFFCLLSYRLFASWVILNCRWNWCLRWRIGELWPNFNSEWPRNAAQRWLMKQVNDRSISTYSFVFNCYITLYEVGKLIGERL